MPAGPAELRAAPLLLLPPLEPAACVHGPEKLCRPASAQHQSAASNQLNADFLFEISDLPAERGLGSMELLLGGNAQAACISHGDEVAEMTELHCNLPCLVSMGPAYKVFFKPTSGF